MTVATVRLDPGDEAGTSLLVTLSAGRPALRFKQVETGVFQEADGPGRIAFVAGIDGSPDRLLMGSAWMAEKMTWYQTPGFQAGTAIACLLLLLSALVHWPIASIRGWRSGRLSPSRTYIAGRAGSQMRPRLVRWLAGVVCALFVAIAIFLLIVLSDPMQVAFGVPTGLRVMLGVATFTALLSPVVVLTAVAVWRGRYFTLTGRVHFTLVAVASAVFSIWLNHWNLLGFRF